MARLIHYQTSFADGQISPRLTGYVDSEAYRSSLADIQNFVVMPQGSLTRRPGTRYVADTKSNGAVRLIPFNFGQDQAYVLEFGDEYVRFYKDGAQLQNGGSAYEIGSPYGVNDLDNLSWTQSADVLFIAHPNYQPRMLIRYGDTSWAFDYVDTIDGPYLSINPKESATLSASGTLTSVDVGNPQVDITDHFFLLANHDLLDGMAIKMALKSGGSTFPKYHVTNPSGTGVLFNGSTTYYVVNASSTTFQLALAVGDKPVYLIERNDEVEIKKQIYPKGKAVTLKVGDGTSALWATPGSKTKGSIVTYTETSGAVVASDGSSDLLFTDAGHGLVNDDRIQFRHASGSLPGGILESINYYVKKIDANTFNISLTPSTGANTTIDYDSSVGSNVSWYKDPLFYTCIADHDSSANNYPGSVLGNDSWDILDINGGRGFEHYDVDTYVRYNPLQGAAISWGNVHVDSVTNALTIPATVKEDLVAAGPNHEWRKYAWNSNAGWPRTVEIFQQRLCFGGNDDKPQTVWFSKTGDFFNFASSDKIGISTGNVSPTGARIIGEQIKDDNAISLTISSATVDLIDWMISGKKLTIGTSGGVFQMYGSENEISLTPFNFSIDRVTTYPTDTGTQPLIIDNNVLYVQDNGRKVREVAYNAESGQNAAADMTIRADDITIQKVKEIVYQDMPYNLVWCRLNDGKVVAMTYNRTLKMYAWSNHVIGGVQTDATLGDHAKVERLVVIPTDTHSQLWMVVNRDIAETSDRGVATITITDYTNIASGVTFTLTDTDGDQKVFTCGGAGSTGTDHDTWMTNESNNTTADNIYTMLNEAGNEAWTVANPAANVVTITQASGGSSGTVVSSDSTRVAVTGFTGDFSTKRCIEYMDRFYDSGELTSDDAHFVDSGIYDTVGSVTGVFTAATTDIITDTSHGLVSDDIVQVSSTVTLPTGLSANTNYWIDKIDANTFKFKNNSTGQLVDIESTGAGVHTWTLQKKKVISVTHLEGQELRVLADSAIQNNVTVSSASVTLDSAADKVHLGLAYDSFIATLPLSQGPTGVLIGNRKKIHRIVVKMLDTMGLKYGPRTTELDETIFRFSSDSLGQAVPFFTGEKVLTMGNMTYDDHFIVLGQDGPFPVTILLLGFDYDSNDL